MKHYCINLKGLLPNELTLNKGYWKIRQVYDQILLLNNFGHEQWYKLDRFMTTDPMQADVDDSDVKIWKEKS